MTNLDADESINAAKEAGALMHIMKDNVGPKEVVDAIKKSLQP